jgi:hypothetical protein
MYKIATSEPYGFLYIHMVAKSKKDMFYINFDRKIVLTDEWVYVSTDPTEPASSTSFVGVALKTFK